MLRRSRSGLVLRSHSPIQRRHCRGTACFVAAGRAWFSAATAQFNVAIAVTATFGETRAAANSAHVKSRGAAAHVCAVRQCSVTVTGSQSNTRSTADTTFVVVEAGTSSQLREGTRRSDARKNEDRLQRHPLFPLFDCVKCC